VTPTPDADVVEISAIADGKITSRDRLDASGRPQAINAGGCTGTTRANWSGDQRRVFLRSSVRCQGQESETSAILAIANTGGGEWIDVRSVTAGGNSEVRVARYRDAGVPSAVPAELAAALRDRSRSVRTARLASTTQIGPREIIEASRSADAAIVEAWLLESGQQYAVDARTLSELADAGVPSRVTDAMVSVSRSQASDERYTANGERVVERVVEREVVNTYDPWGYGYGYYPAPYPVRYRPVYSYSPVVFSFSLFGFGRYPYGYPYSPFGYYPYAYRPVVYAPFIFGFGFGHSYGRNYYRPPVVVGRPYHPQPSTPRVAHPRVVRDQGYTQQRSEPRNYYSTPRNYVERPRASAQADGRSRGAAQPAAARPSGGGVRTAHVRR
jgi:hypothetical protein